MPKRVLILKGWDIDGRGWRKWKWFFFFPMLGAFTGADIRLHNCIVHNFLLRPSDLRWSSFARELKEKIEAGTWDTK